jgi:hypothetical protein
LSGRNRENEGILERRDDKGNPGSRVGSPRVRAKGQVLQCLGKKDTGRMKPQSQAMTTSPPERERPWTLFASAVTGTLLGGAVGLGVNYLAGKQPGDLDGLLLPPIPLPPEAFQYWTGRMARGLLGGLWWGGVLALVFTARAGNLTGARCPYALALRCFGIIVLGALLGWPILGTGWGCFLGAVVGLYVALSYLRLRWLRAQVAPLDPTLGRRVPSLFEDLTLSLVLRGLAVCVAGGLLGFALGGLGGSLAVGLCPQEFEWVRRMGGFGIWRTPEQALWETACESAWAGAFLGLLTAGVLAQVINHARLVRTAHEAPAQATWEGTHPEALRGDRAPGDQHGITRQREGYREET